MDTSYERLLSFPSDVGHDVPSTDECLAVGEEVGLVERDAPADVTIDRRASPCY